MNELKNNYSDLDYPSLRVGADSFEAMAAKAQDASPVKRKVKVY